MKTLFILGNNIGGVGTSTAAAYITGALRLLGCETQLADGDSVNRTVSSMEPSALPLDVKNPDELDRFFHGLKSTGEDLIVMDTPANSCAALGRFFASQGPGFLQNLGTRIVIGVVIDQTEYSVIGAADWLHAFPEELEYLLIVNTIRESDKGATLRHELQAFCEGRTIMIPKTGEPNVRKLDPQKVLPASRLPQPAFHVFHLRVGPCVRFPASHFAPPAIRIPPSAAPALRSSAPPSQSISRPPASSLAQADRAKLFSLPPSPVNSAPAIPPFCRWRLATG